MNRILLSVISLLVLSGWVDSASLNSQCGYTPKYPSPAPDEYSWTASLQYGNRPSFGFCDGSVISSRYVLTVASCVTGKQVDKYGGVTGVRLGDFSRSPICDYGAPNCEHYQEFGISEVIVHANYSATDRTFQNNIALLRLDRSITFTEKLRPICLPFDSPELPDNTTLIVSGWGKLFGEPVKGIKHVMLWSQESCLADGQAESIICTKNKEVDHNRPLGLCYGFSGSSLIYESEPGRMVLEGVVSHVRGRVCHNYFDPSYYTRIRSFQKWIENNTREI